MGLSCLRTSRSQGLVSRSTTPQSGLSLSQTTEGRSSYAGCQKRCSASEPWRHSKEWQSLSAIREILTGRSSLLPLITGASWLTGTSRTYDVARTIKSICCWLMSSSKPRKPCRPLMMVMTRSAAGTTPITNRFHLVSQSNLRLPLTIWPLSLTGGPVSVVQ